MTLTPAKRAATAPFYPTRAAGARNTDGDFLQAEEAHYFRSTKIQENESNDEDPSQCEQE